MRIAVAGATGRIGALTVTELRRRGHEVVPVSRSAGVDLRTSAGLAGALDGVEVVIDTTNLPPASADATVAMFGDMTANLLEEGRRAGVRHHVLLSIAGAHRIAGNAHYAGKQEQERLVTGGPVPWTVVPTTQFHDFAEMAASWTENDGVAHLAPLLVQPIAPADVAEVLAEIAEGPPQGRHVDVAGPDRHDLVDMARRTYAARGRDVQIVPSWNGAFGPSMAGEVLLPSPDARIAPTTFDDWLAAVAVADGRRDRSAT